MKKTLFLLLLPLWLLAQNSTSNKITFKEGENFRTALILPGVTPTGVTVTFKNTLGIELQKFSTVGNTITQVNDSSWTFTFTDQRSLGKSGRGNWQIEVRSTALGVTKTENFPYEIYKSTTLTTGSPITAGAYNAVVKYDFTPATPTVSLIYSGIVLVDGASISDALANKVDKVTGYGLSQNNYSNAAKAIVDAVTANLATKLNISDTVPLLRKTTAAGLYVAKVTGQSLITDAERTKLTALPTATTLSDSIHEKVNTTDLNGLIAANSAVAANTAKVTNANHSGDATGSTILTITADAVTNAKLANVPASTIKGRVTSGAGDPEDLSISQTRTLLGVNLTDNTPDSGKPISTATQAALNLKMAFVQVNTYEEMLALGTPSVLTEITVLVDENKGRAETIYRWSPSGRRKWIPEVNDN